MKQRMSLKVFGQVQGINLRSMIKVKALELGLVGFVMNIDDGTVSLEAEGERPALEALMGWLRERPGNCRIDRLADDWVEATGQDESFMVKY